MQTIRKVFRKLRLRVNVTLTYTMVHLTAHFTSATEIDFYVKK